VLSFLVRTHREFRPIIPIVDLEVGMERQFFAVTSDMVENLHGIGISVTEHVLYLTVTSHGAIRIVPGSCAQGPWRVRPRAQLPLVAVREMALLRAFGISRFLPTMAGSHEHKCTKTEEQCGRAGVFVSWLNVVGH
jgi:hypothetical protein